MAIRASSSTARSNGPAQARGRAAVLKGIHLVKVRPRASQRMHSSFGDMSASEAAANAMANNDAFKAIFAESLARSGGMGAVTQGESQEPKKSNMEIVLTSSTESSKAAFSRLVNMRNNLEASIEREAKQLERLQFTYEKCKSDQAYYKSLRMVLDQGANSNTPNPSCPIISPMEELLLSSIDASNKTLRSMKSMLAEVQGALERESKQVERLQFASKKCLDDEAYYKSLRMMLEEGSE